MCFPIVPISMTKLTVAFTVSDHLPFTPVELAVDPKRENKRALRDFAASIMTLRCARREFMRRARLALGFISEPERVVPKCFLACRIALGAQATRALFAANV